MKSTRARSAAIETCFAFKRASESVLVRLRRGDDSSDLVAPDRKGHRRGRPVKQRVGLHIDRETAGVIRRPRLAGDIHLGHGHFDHRTHRGEFRVGGEHLAPKAFIVG